MKQQQLPEGGSRYRLMFWMFMQLFAIYLYAQFVKYDEEATHVQTKFHESLRKSPIDLYLPCYNDIHVMIALAFGLLMTFLSKYYLSSMGFSLWLTAFSIQWYIIFVGFWENVFHRHFGFIEISISKIILCDYAAGAILISIGGSLGKATLNQLTAMAFIELIIYSLNEVILVEQLKVTDIGGSMLIHAFGAYFGLAFARVMTNKKQFEKDSKHMTSNKFSDLFSLLGTVYLWMFWPSFNGALASSAEQRHRVLCNTFLSLCASCVATFIVSRILRKKFGLPDIQNATLAGGVAIGTAADLFQSPFNPGIVGFLAGTISTIGFAVIQPKLEKIIGLYETCGIHNLHGMPGILGAITGIIAVYMEYDTLLKGSFGSRDKVDQSFCQFYGLLITLGLAIGGGLLTGLIVRIGSMNFKDDLGYYQDSVEWNFTYDNNECKAEENNNKKITKSEEAEAFIETKQKEKEIELQQMPQTQELNLQQNANENDQQYILHGDEYDNYVPQNHQQHIINNNDDDDDDAQISDEGEK